MPDLGYTARTALEWDGSEQAARGWANESANQIEKEATTGVPGLVAETFDELIAMADSSADTAAWGLVGLFGPADMREVAAHGLHKVMKLFGSAARGVRSLFRPLTMLLQRYFPKLKALAARLGASGYSLGVQFPPPGFSFALSFDLP